MFRRRLPHGSLAGDGVGLFDDGHTWPRHLDAKRHIVSKYAVLAKDGTSSL